MHSRKSTIKKLFSDSPCITSRLSLMRVHSFWVSSDDSQNLQLENLLQWLFSLDDSLFHYDLLPLQCNKSITHFITLGCSDIMFNYPNWGAFLHFLLSSLLGCWVIYNLFLYFLVKCNSYGIQIVTLIHIFIWSFAKFYFLFLVLNSYY